MHLHRLQNSCFDFIFNYPFFLHVNYCKIHTFPGKTVQHLTFFFLQDCFPSHSVGAVRRLPCLTSSILGCSDNGVIGPSMIPITCLE